MKKLLLLIVVYSFVNGQGYFGDGSDGELYIQSGETFYIDEIRTVVNGDNYIDDPSNDDWDDSNSSGLCFDLTCDPLYDANGDGFVNILDVILVVSIILDDGYSSIADINSDYSVDILDVVAMINIILDNNL